MYIAREVGKMKQTGRNIKRRLYAFTLLHNRLQRAKSYRGYGIHSPFVYMLVRRAFMATSVERQGEGSLYDVLLRSGIAKRRAVQLQAAFDYCKAECFSVDGKEGDFRIFTQEYPAELLAKACRAAQCDGATAVIMKPYADRERQSVCQSIVECHDSTSVDNRGFLMLFNTKKLPKQHFRL